MWGILVAGAVFLGTLVMSLAKASSRGERLAEQHRIELMNRKNGKHQLFKGNSMDQPSGDSKKSSESR